MNCGLEIEVGPYIKCNTQVCPHCGSTLRATETGEYHISQEVSTMLEISSENIPCPTCNYPVPMPSAVGEEVKCVYCGSISKAIRDITVPSTVVVGFITFTLGAILGPALWSAVKGGATVLERLTREHIR
jgi:ferredoxin